MRVHVSDEDDVPVDPGADSSPRSSRGPTPGWGEPPVIEPGPVAPVESLEVPAHLLAWQLSRSAFVRLDESVGTRLHLTAE